MSDEIDHVLVAQACDVAEETYRCNPYASMPQIMRAALAAVAPAIRERERQACAEIAEQSSCECGVAKYATSREAIAANNMAIKIYDAILARGDK